VSSIIGVGFALVCSFLKSGSDLSSKYFIEDELNPLVASFGYRAFAIPVLAILVAIFGIPEVDRAYWTSLVIITPLNVVATILYMKALEVSDISIVSPIKAISPMALLVTSPIMINEYASPIGIIGVVIVTAGVYALKISAEQESFLEPVRKLKEEKGARFAFYVMLIYSVSANMDKIGVEASSAVFWTLSSHISISLVLFLVVIYKLDDGMKQIRGNADKLLPMGTLSGLAVAAQMIAITYTLVVYVIAVKRTALLWNILGGTLLLNESGIRKKLGAGILIVIGVVIISISL
jgi:drug/metabolite transporter (DMT)-like permease